MGTSVLIVEDESIVALDLRNRLTGLGFTVVGHAASGEDAVRLAGEHRPDVILMDIQIKGPIDGIETADRIQRSLGIPSIFLTAYSDGDSLERTKGSNAYGYLLKPFQERDVLITIEMALYKHRAERELIRNRRMLRTTLETIGDAVITTDDSDRIVFFNRAAEELTGWDAEAATGEMAGTVLQLQEFQVREGAPDPSGPQRFILTDLSSRSKTVEVLSRPIEGTENSLPRVIVLRDIANLIQYEESILRAKEAAEAADRAKSDFLSRMSHELRTPLNSIIGMAELSLDTPVSDGVRDNLKIVRRSADTLMAIISDVLDYAAYDQKKLRLRKEQIEIEQLLKAITETAAIDARHKELRFCTIVDPGLPFSVTGDAQRIMQLATHLLSNAIKFTLSGHIVFEIQSLTPAVATGEAITIRFRVEDTGVGIPDELQNRVFDDFVQIEDPATRNAGGSGLGLAIVKRIVDAMDGIVTVQTVPDSGTVFTVDLPLTVADPTPLLGAHALNPAEESPSRIVGTGDLLLARAIKPWLTARGDTLQFLSERPGGGDDCDVLLLLKDDCDRHNRTIYGNSEKPALVLVDTKGQRFSPAFLEETGIAGLIREPLLPDVCRTVVFGDFVSDCTGDCNDVADSSAEPIEEFRKDDIVAAIQNGDISTARELVKSARGSCQAPGVLETLFRLQLALRRDDLELAERLCHEIQ